MYQQYTADGAAGIISFTLCRGLDSNPRQLEEEKVEEIGSEWS